MIAALIRPAHGGYPPRRLPSAECADMIAMLEQRIDTCEVMIKHSPQWEDLARDRKRQLEILIDELRAGRHHDFAFVRAMLQSFDRAQDERGLTA